MPDRLATAQNNNSWIALNKLKQNCMYLNRHSTELAENQRNSKNNKQLSSNAFSPIFAHSKKINYLDKKSTLT